MRTFFKTLFKAFALSIRKLPAMAGGLFTLLLAFFFALVAFFTAHGALAAKAPSALRVAYLDNDGTALSNELISAVRGANGASVELRECKSLNEAEALMDGGAVEGVLVIAEGLEKRLTDGKSAFEYFPAAGTMSADAVMELVSGEAVTIGSRLRMKAYFERVSGEAPSEEKKAELEKAFYAYLAASGEAVESFSVRSFGALNDEKTGEMGVFGAFFARYSGFCSFVIMLLLLMLGAFSGSRDEKNCAERMRSFAFGESVSFLSELFALMLTGLILLALSFIPSGGAGILQIGAGIAYVFCTSALALLLGSVSGSARAELASPLVAFLTSLAGGCFSNVSALGAGFETLSRFTPQGQYLAAMNGQSIFIPILIALALLLILIHRGANRAAQALRYRR